MLVFNLNYTNSDVIQYNMQVNVYYSPVLGRVQHGPPAGPPRYRFPLCFQAHCRPALQVLLPRQRVREGVVLPVHHPHPDEPHGCEEVLPVRPQTHRPHEHK